MISIIIPCYNAEKYIRQCIDSIQRQNMDDIEVICLDDASIDCTLDILNEYAKYDKRIRIIHSEENLKQGKQRNIGIGIANGEYIMFLDSDDWLCDDALSVLHECAKRTDADVVVGDYIEYSQGSGEQRRDCLFEAERVISSKEYLEKCIFSWRKLYKADLLKENDIKFAEGIFYEDTVFRYISSWYVKNVVYIHVPICYYRRHETNTTVRVTAQNEYYKFVASKSIYQEAISRSLSGWYLEAVLVKYREDSFNILLEMYLGFEKIEQEYAGKIRHEIQNDFACIEGTWKKQLIYTIMIKYPRLFGCVCLLYRYLVIKN